MNLTQYYKRPKSVATFRSRRGASTNMAKCLLNRMDGLQSEEARKAQERRKRDSR